MTSTAVVELLWADILGPPTAATISSIERAFSYDGLGLLTVSGVPHFVEARAAALPFARAFAVLPEAAKAPYVHSASTYSFGWSHGKEAFNGQPDTAKGSYYFNPMQDAPGGRDAAALPPDLLPFLHPNIWPAADVCPGFEAACKALAQLMVAVGGELARHVDAYVAARAAAAGGAAPLPSQQLETIVKRSRTHKARLLYYYAAAEAGEGAAAGGAGGAGSAPAPWCGAHNDHGSLTALTSAQFFQEASGDALPACPDAAAGLYIKTRAGETVHAKIPRDAMAFQIGECAQIMSGGALQATPHWVRAPSGAASAGVGRGTMAVFMCVLAASARARPHAFLFAPHFFYIPRTHTRTHPHVFSLSRAQGARAHGQHDHARGRRPRGSAAGRPRRAAATWRAAPRHALDARRQLCPLYQKNPLLLLLRLALAASCFISSVSRIQPATSHD